MPVQAIPLALVASLYPFGLAVLLLLFDAPRSRARALVFLMGAAVSTLTIGFVVVFVLRGAGVHNEGNESARYGLRLAIGLLFLVAAWVVAHRVPKPKEEGKPSRVTTAVGGSSLLAAFLVGVALYTPSPSYLSAIQVVGSTNMSTAATSVWVVIVAALVLITIEVPTIVYLVAPGWTTRKLAAFGGWLDRNARRLLVVVLVVLGVWQAVDGIVGLL